MGKAKEDNETSILNNAKPAHNIKSKDGKLREKVFVERESRLTVLFQTKVLFSVYNMFIVFWILFFIQTAVYEYTKYGRLYLGMSTIAKVFAKPMDALYLWTAMFAATLLVYPVFVLWAKIRASLNPKSKGPKLICDILFSVIYLVFIYLYWSEGIKMFVKINFNFGWSSVLTSEQARFFMKYYSFVRNNVPRTRNYKPHTENSILYPKFSSYFYFLFAPTAIYQDEYPRTQAIRWNKFALHVCETLGAAFFALILTEKFLIGAYQNFGKADFELHMLPSYMTEAMIPVGAVYMSLFYILFHSWQNAWGELLRFGDRLFYEEWWTSTTYVEFYRTWNVIVHDWLFTYVYKEFYENIVPKNRTVATLVTFISSSIVHEYVLASSCKFFYPVMLLFFGGFGIALVFIMGKTGSKNGNLFVWFSLIVGNSLMMSSYFMEHYVRINCPFEQESKWNFFIPRTWTCPRSFI